MSDAPETEGTGKNGDQIPWRRIAAIAVVAYAVLFLILNDDRVEVSFVLFSTDTSLIFLILISMGLGAALALFGPAWWRRRQRQRQGDGSGQRDEAGDKQKPSDQS